MLYDAKMHGMHAYMLWHRHALIIVWEYKGGASRISANNLKLNIFKKVQVEKFLLNISILSNIYQAYVFHTVY